MSNRTTPPAKQANHTNQRPVKRDPEVVARNMVENFSDQIMDLLPEHIGAGRFLRVMTIELARNPELLDCTKESVISCMLDMSKLGLEPGTFGGCHMVPFSNNANNTKEATLIVDYKGIVELAKRTGDVQTVEVRIVKEKDQFAIEDGKIVHTYDPFNDDRGKAKGAYCIFTFKDGSQQYDIMSKAEIEKTRQGSPGRNSPAWKNHWEEQAKKTVLKRASKMVRLSPEASDNGVAKTKAIEFERPQDPARTLQHTQAKGIEQQRDETVPLDKLESSGRSTHTAAMEN